MRLNWAKNFLERGGFSFILKHFVEKEITQEALSDLTTLKDFEFLLVMMRVFLTAAFPDEEHHIAKAVALVRKSSSVNEDDEIISKKENPPQDQLKSLLSQGPGMLILMEVNFEDLVEKLLKLVICILAKPVIQVQDKLTVENALSLLVGCLLYEPSLGKYLVTEQCAELLLAGLVHTRHEKVKQDFKSSWS